MKLSLNPEMDWPDIIHRLNDEAGYERYKIKKPYVLKFCNKAGKYTVCYLLSSSKAAFIEQEV